MISPLVRILYYLFLKRPENYINDKEAAEIAMQIIIRESENGSFQDIEAFKQEMADFLVCELIRASNESDD